MNPASALDRGAALRQVRHVIERLVRDGTAVARSDGTVHQATRFANCGLQVLDEAGIAELVE